MKKLSMSVKALSLVSVLVALAVCNVSCSPSFDVTVPVGETSLPSIGGLAAGAHIPDNLGTLTLPIPANLPSRDTIEGYITDAGFGFVLDFVTLQKVELTRMELVASQGTFEGLTDLGFAWQPGAVNGVLPPVVDLGTATSAAGTLGAADVVLVPDPTPDLLALIEATHDTGATPKLSVTVHGNVPSQLPQWGFTMRLRITIKLGL